MTKQTIESLQAQLNSIQQQIEELANEKEATKGDTPWALVDVNEDCYFVALHLNGEVDEGGRYNDLDLNSFKERSVAEGFANAFHVMIALRQCEGAGKLDSEDCGWVVDLMGDADWFSTAEHFSLFPPFPSERHAVDAAKKVGHDKIIAAYKFLSNVE